MSRTKIIAGIFLCSSILHAQTATYKDVAVIINTNSAISDSIGMYFVEQRNIPAENIILVNVPTTEEIDSLQFESLRAQIESHLITNNLKDSINFLVTTKGVPLKVLRSISSRCSSVESDLTLILGPYASFIGKSGKYVSPYYKKTDDFLRSRYGIYLVTRLDGYTYNDVKGIIDRTGSIESAVPDGSQFVFDIDPQWNSTLLSLNLNMSKISHTLQSRGYSSYLDSTTTYLTHQSNVIGYASWGSNDYHASTHGIVNNTWVRGAIAETYVSTSGRSFSLPASYGQSLIADLIAEGITAAKGYVYEPYSTAIADVSVLFDRYVSGYTVAESYYSASPYLSWMDVIIGDPKFRLTSPRLPSDYVPYGSGNGINTLPVEIISFTGNTKSNGVELNWKTAAEKNNYGFEIEKSVISNQSSVNSNPQSEIKNLQWSKVGFVDGSGTSNSPKSYSFIEKNISAGKYSYRLKQIDRDGNISYSKEIEIAINNVPEEFSLGQNFPNPFNPTTTINYQLPMNSHVTLKVYDAIGREVATLVNEVKEAGSYTVQLSINNYQLSSGVYFYKLTTGEFTAVKKFVLMK